MLETGMTLSSTTDNFEHVSKSKSILLGWKKQLLVLKKMSAESKDRSTHHPACTSQIVDEHDDLIPFYENTILWDLHF